LKAQAACNISYGDRTSLGPEGLAHSGSHPAETKSARPGFTSERRSAQACPSGSAIYADCRQPSRSPDAAFSHRQLLKSRTVRFFVQAFGGGRKIVQ
jgi:hypothetical protein